MYYIVFSERRKEYAMGTTPYSIRLDDDLRKSLEKEAEFEDRPPAQLVVRAIRSMLEAKAAKRAAIDSALEEADQGKFISADAMNAWIDSWDSENELPAPKADIIRDSA
jgi:predicted transcriptional regulator